MAGVLGKANVLRHEVAPQFFVDHDRAIFLEGHADELHGAVTETAIKQLTAEFGESMQFKEWTVRGPGFTYEHLR